MRAATTMDTENAPNMLNTGTKKAKYEDDESDDENEEGKRQYAGGRGEKVRREN